MNYIGFENSLSLTNPPTGDIYDFMAGGLFDGYYAGSYAYNSLILPAPDLRSFFTNQSFSLTAGLLGLNEDFCEFVLMPIQIMTLREDKNRSFRAIVNTAKKISDIKDKIDMKEGGGSSGFSASGGGESKGGFGGHGGASGIAAFANELKNDSVIENMLEQVGSMFGGPIGAMLMGVAYDGFQSGRFVSANIPEAIYGGLKSMMSNSAINLGSKALGVSASPIGYMGVAMVVGAVVNELFEMAFGLDNHFGFGGDYVTSSYMGATYHEAPMSIKDGILGMLGLLDGVGVVSDATSYEETAQIEGWKNKAGVWMDLEHNFDTRDGRAKGYGLSGQEKADAKAMAEMMNEMYEGGGSYDPSDAPDDGDPSNGGTNGVGGDFGNYGGDIANV